MWAFYLLHKEQGFLEENLKPDQTWLWFLLCSGLFTCTPVRCFGTADWQDEIRKSVFLNTMNVVAGRDRQTEACWLAQGKNLLTLG